MIVLITSVPNDSSGLINLTVISLRRKLIDTTRYKRFVDVRNPQFRRKRCLAGKVRDKRSNDTEESSIFKYLMIAIAPCCEKCLRI